MKERDFHVQCESIPFVIITVLLQIFFENYLYLCGRIKNTNK